VASVDVLNLKNEKVGSVDLNDSVFGADINDALIYEAVRQYLASRRSGSAKVKRRAEVSGSGKKLWRQKGTGRARMGSIRSPIWRHGGTVHGPVPRDYSYRLPRKMLLGALRSALSAKLRDGELKVINEFALTDHKTKNLANALKGLGVNKTVLIVDVLTASADGPQGNDRNLTLSARNLEGVKLVPTREVNVYDLLSHKQVLLSQAAANKLSEALAK
jgi:large subunit ribosomal protein L4